MKSRGVRTAPWAIITRTELRSEKSEKREETEESEKDKK